MRAAFLLTLAPFLHAQLVPTLTLPDDQIQALLNHRSEPTVAAIIDAQGRRILTNSAATPTTTFDIGAIAPTLTALLLQNMAASGDVALNDPATKYLPAGTTLPARGNKQITLLDLATHTSGLPSAAPAPAELTRKPGSKYEYSPLGISLLNQALAARAKTDYETLLRTRILDPLDMHDTRFDADHHLRSTAGDLLKLLAAYMNYAETPLNKDAQALMKTRRPIAEEREASLGWQVRKTNYCARKGVCFMNQNYDVFTSNGSIAFDPNSRSGVVVLSSTGGTDLSGIALYLIAPNTYPLTAQK